MSTTDSIVSTTQATTTTVTFATTTTMSTGTTPTVNPVPLDPMRIRNKNLPVTKIKNISTPLLTEFFKRKGPQTYNFTAAPRQDINTRLQKIADSSCKPKEAVRIKRNLNRPLDSQSRRTQLKTPDKDIVFGQNPFSTGPVTNPFAYKPQQPSIFGFSPDPSGATADVPKNEFEHKFIQAIKSDSVFSSMTALIDSRCSSLMSTIQEQLVLLNARLDKNEGKVTHSEATLPDPRGTASAYRPHDNALITPQILASDRVDQNTRRTNIKIAGLLEYTRDKTFRSVIDLFKEMDVDVRDTDILRCHRLGKKTTTRTRPVLVVFTSMSLRSLVMRHRYRLYEQARNLSHIHINEDLTPARSSLIYKCRISGRFKSVWTYDGDAYVRPWNRDSNAKGDRIFSESDISKYPPMQSRRTNANDNDDEEEEEDED